MAHYVSHLIGNYGECWIARGRWGRERGHHSHSHSNHTAGRRSRERASASDARGWNSLGQGREVLTFVNGRGAELCA